VQSGTKNGGLEVLDKVGLEKPKIMVYFQRKLYCLIPL